MRNISVTSYIDTNAKTITARVHISVKLQGEGSLGRENMVAKIKNHGFSSTHLQQNIQERNMTTSRYWQRTMKIGEEGDYQRVCTSEI